MIFNMLRKPTRYLDLKLEPIGYPAPVKLALRSEFIIAALFAASYGLTNDKAVVAESMTGAAIGIGVCEIYRRQNKRICTALFGDAVIDKLPSEHDKASSFKHRAAFQRKASRFVKNGIVDLGFAGFGLSFSATGHHMPMLPSILGCYAALHLTQAFTFKRLATGEWALSDEPPKDKFLDHLKSKAPEVKLAPQAV